MEKQRSTIYVSHSVWERFRELTKRDSMSMSETIEGFIEDWLKLHEPGNPQRPITAFVKGHPDEEIGVRDSLLKVILDYAKKRGMEVKHSIVVDLVRENTFKGKGRLVVIKAMEADLKKQGVTIVY